MQTTQGKIKFTEEDLLHHRERLATWLYNIKVDGEFRIPVAFTDCVFIIKEPKEKIPFDWMLKDWVSRPASECCEGDKRDDIPTDGCSSGVGGAGSITGACEEEVLDTDSVEFRRALENLNSFFCDDEIDNIKALKDLSDNYDSYTEEEILVCVGIHLIERLCGKGSVVTSIKRSQMKCPCSLGCGQKLKGNTEMCIGSANTIHGELDLLCCGVGVTVQSTEEHDSNNTEIDNSNSETDSRNKSMDTEQNIFDAEKEQIDLEIKKDDSNTKRHRHIIAQCITFAFVEQNIHEYKSPYIPTILIDHHQFAMLAYNPEADILIRSDNFRFFLGKKKHKDEYAHIVLLWIILNYELFFKKNLPKFYSCRCGFKEACKKANCLVNYKKLDGFVKSVHVDLGKLELQMEWNSLRAPDRRNKVL